MALSLKRITSSGNFIPEIDGLRFIAIASVVLFHLNAFFTEKATEQYSAAYFTPIKEVVSRGGLGVPLFFIISGFILGMPFAKFHLRKGKPVVLKEYFFRRLTRLEPPYILTMTLLFIATVFVVKKLPLMAALKSYIASIFYVHNFVYGEPILPLLNVVAWSLEIEVQFYILAPLLTYVFAIQSASARRMWICLATIVFLAFNNFVDLPFLSLLDYIQFFLIGFLLVDLYVTDSYILPRRKLDSLIGILFFIVLVALHGAFESPGIQKFLVQLVQLGCIFVFYYYALLHRSFRLLSFRWVTNIGGMCYSIYLLHFAIISMIGNPLLKYSVPNFAGLNILIYTLVLLAAILIVSSVFFILVERPCMDKNWYKKIFRRGNLVEAEAK